MKYLLLILFFPLIVLNAQSKSDVEINSLLKGTLFTPDVNKTQSLVILIAGSGPTNRSGNSVGNHNNSLLFLSQELQKNGIAAFSFDKRVVAQLIAGENAERELLFSRQVDDVRDIISYFKTSKKYKKIIIAGHSEGSLIGMIAAHNNADGYISIAGAGRTIDEILIEQIVNQMPSLKTELELSFNQLKEKKEITSKNPIIASLFRQDIQPFLKSWVDLNPQHEIKKLKIPVLILNGTKDLQIKESDADLLKLAKPDAKLVIIPNMNHIFKEILIDDAENIASYNNPKIPIMPELTSSIVEFVNAIKK